MDKLNPTLDHAPAQLSMAIDAGLRAFMLGVYNKMALGSPWGGILT